MAEQITKKDLEKMAGGIIDAVDIRFRRMDERLEGFRQKIKSISALRELESGTLGS